MSQATRLTLAPRPRQLHDEPLVLRSKRPHQSWIHRRFAAVSPAMRAAIIHSTLARKPMESIACILKRRT